MSKRAPKQNRKTLEKAADWTEPDKADRPRDTTSTKTRVVAVVRNCQKGQISEDERDRQIIEVCEGRPRADLLEVSDFLRCAADMGREKKRVELNYRVAQLMEELERDLSALGPLNDWRYPELATPSMMKKREDLKASLLAAQGFSDREGAIHLPCVLYHDGPDAPLPCDPMDPADSAFKRDLNLWLIDYGVSIGMTKTDAAAAIGLSPPAFATTLRNRLDEMIRDVQKDG